MFLNFLFFFLFVLFFNGGGVDDNEEHLSNSGDDDEATCKFVEEVIERALMLPSQVKGKYVFSHMVTIPLSINRQSIVRTYIYLCMLIVRGVNFELIIKTNMLDLCKNRLARNQIGLKKSNYLTN